MSLALQALYAEAQQQFKEGHLQQCRDTVEDILVATDASHSSGNVTAAEELCRHELFSSSLLLLSACYSAVGSFDEAERLLSTCEGYIVEHRAAHRVDDSAAAEQRVRVALATVRYTRAAVRLEHYRTQENAPLSLVREADEVFLAAAEAALADVLGPPRQLLADVWHCRGVCSELLCEATDGGGGGGEAALPYVRAIEFYTRSMDLRARYRDEAGVAELKLALTLEHVAHLYRLGVVATPDHMNIALRLLGTVAEVRRRRLGSRHPLYASTLLAQGALAVGMGMYRTARTTLRAALAIVQDVYPPGDVRVAEVEYWLSRVK